MVFKCQEDSFLKEYSSRVVSCEKGQFQQNEYFITDGYNVIMDDTILFPEGGGQPCDYGFLNDKPVLNVTRMKDQAVHFVVSNEPFEVGESVTQNVDWNRRLDHMQQHSGQHLITAVFYNDYGYKTTTWNLGLETSFIELDAKFLTNQQVSDVEKKVNQLISNRVDVSVLTVDNCKGEIPSQVTRAMKGLPKDHSGPIRVIVIDGIDSNMCCGTHVKNLSELQMIKLLHVEKSKDKYLVHFVVGGRVLSKFKKIYTREMEFNILLNCGPPTHIEMVEKIKNNLKNTQRNLQKVLKELAIEQAQRIMALQPAPKYYCLHRKDGLDSDFVNTFLRHVTNDAIFCFLTSGDDTGKGLMVLRGTPNDIATLGPIICATLDGKGHGKKERFQAKINNLKAIPQCEDKIKEYFQ